MLLRYSSIYLLLGVGNQNVNQSTVRYGVVFFLDVLCDGGKYFLDTCIMLPYSCSTFWTMSAANSATICPGAEERARGWLLVSARSEWYDL